MRNVSLAPLHMKARRGGLADEFHEDAHGRIGRLAVVNDDAFRPAHP
jgi:hypothetical protein